MAASWLGSRVFVCVVAIFLSISGVLGIDVSTELDFETELQQRKQFGNSSFIFSFNDPAATAFGDLRTLFINNDEVLATLPNGGVSQNLVTLKACAINQPHNHPRGTEISHVLKGTLLFGFAEENTGRPFIGGNVKTGQTVIIPQGLIHFAQNLECEEGQFIASFPNRDPGTVTTALTFFNLPESAIRATTGLTDSQIKTIKASVDANPNPSLDHVCAKRCGIKY